MVKLPGKAFLKVVPKASEVGRYSILTPWVAMVQGRWCFCATNGRAAVMRPVESPNSTALESMPASARIAIPTDTVKDSEPVRLLAKDGGRYSVQGVSGTERPCPDITPPDLDGLMRESDVPSDRVSIMVDAKVLMDALEALLCDLKGKDWGSTKSFVKLSFARKVVEGERDEIDDCSPVMIENDMDCGLGIAKAIVMPVSGDAPKPKERNANTHLIAAAPELLAALEMILAESDHDGYGARTDAQIPRLRAALGTARAAIAKAKGGAA